MIALDTNLLARLLLGLRNFRPQQAGKQGLVPRVVAA
jgi:hypothetical protein